MNKLMGFEEVAEITGIPESTIRRKVTGRRIPCIRLGKHVRFDPADIAAWIVERKVGTVAGGERGVRTAAITLEAIRRAIAFLERQKEHGMLQGNKEWIEEYENAIAVIKQLAVYE